MVYPMRPFIGDEEASLFYSAADAVSGDSDYSRIDEACGTVTHVRGYFDNSGEGLCTTFFGHNGNRLTTPKFTAELKKFMDSLRKDGPLQSTRTLRRFCAENGEGKLPEQGREEYGFIAETEQYRFCLRVVRHIIGGGFSQNKISTVTLFEMQLHWPLDRAYRRKKWLSRLK